MLVGTTSLSLSLLFLLSTFPVVSVVSVVPVVSVVSVLVPLMASRHSDPPPTTGVLLRARGGVASVAIGVVLYVGGSVASTSSMQRAGTGPHGGHRLSD
jgi:hypothetical protein